MAKGILNVNSVVPSDSLAVIDSEPLWVVVDPESFFNFKSKEIVVLTLTNMLENILTLVVVVVPPPDDSKTLFTVKRGMTPDRGVNVGVGVGVNDTVGVGVTKLTLPVQEQLVIVSINSYVIQVEPEVPEKSVVSK